MSEDDHIGFGQLRTWPSHRRVAVDDRSVDLSLKEFDLLIFLMTKPGNVFTYAELLKEVWGSELPWQKNTVVEHMNRLRRKLKLDPNKPPWLETVRGVGYRYERRNWSNQVPPTTEKRK